MVDEKGLSKSVIVDRKTSPLKSKLYNSDRVKEIEEDEDQPSLQSPAPRKQEFNQI
jgi:hypothetical protein